jgi:CPA2 family monovalent cation:H+ antiporter-2
VLKLLQVKGEINSPYKKISLVILFFQDIIVVSLMLFTPLIAGKAEKVITNLLFLLMKGLFTSGFVVLSARFVVL